VKVLVSKELTYMSTCFCGDESLRWWSKR